MIYLDNAATTKMDMKVFEAMLPWLFDRYGNPGSLHPLGREAAEAVEYARSCVARVFSCEKDHIIFTAGGSEGNNLVIKGLVPYMKRNGRSKILISAIEHDSVIHAVEDVCVKHGFYYERIPVKSDGILDFDKFSELLSDDVGLVSVMTVNNELGNLVWSENVAEECHKRGILFHSDCVQAVYDYSLSCKDTSAPDFMTISSHKIHGPKGVGAVYAKKKDQLSAIISGGHDQEFGLRGGTENVAGIVGFGKACSLVMDGTEERDPDVYGQIFLDEITSRLGEDAFVKNGSSEAGKTINIRFVGVDAQTLVLAAGSHGVCVSAGSACRSNETEASHVLKAIGLSDDEARECVRISFSRKNNEFEVREGARVLCECIEQLKGAST